MFSIRVAGVTIRLEGAVESAARRYAPYAQAGTPDLVLELVEGEPPKSRRWPFPSVTRDRGVIVASRRDFCATVSRGRGRAITRGDPKAIDSVLRILLSEILAERGGMLVHSAAIGGRLFPGKTDAGKTTLASLAGASRVLSDELPAVVPARSGFDLFGTPFWGSFVRGTNLERRRLRSVFFLDRHRREWIRRIDAADAAVRLLECVLCFLDEDARARNFLSSAARVVSSVPCFALSYDATRTGWRELSRRLDEADPSAAR